MEEILKCKCGLTYVPGLESDEAQHSAHHDKWVNGQPIPTVPYERVIGKVDKMDVLESSHDLPLSYRRKLAEVARLAQSDMPDYPIGYDGGEDTEGSTRAYILREQERGVGLILISKDDRFWPFKWAAEKVIICSHEASETERWVIKRLWIVSKLRKQHVARRLLDVVANHIKNEICEFGWELPFTEDGKHFVRSACPKSFWGSGDPTIILRPGRLDKS